MIVCLYQLAACCAFPETIADTLAGDTRAMQTSGTVVALFLVTCCAFPVGVTHTRSVLTGAMHATSPPTIAEASIAVTTIPSIVTHTSINCTCAMLSAAASLIAGRGREPCTQDGRHAALASA